MPYTEVVLVRHAEAKHMETPDIIAGQAPWSDLTVNGHAQSINLGELWGELQRNNLFSPDAAFSSPLKRAYDTLDTALRIAPISLNIESCDLLAELCLGADEGKPHSKVYTDAVKQNMKDKGAAYIHPGHNSEGTPGESIDQRARHMANYLIMLQTSKPFRSVVTMSHQMAIKACVSLIEIKGGLQHNVNPQELHALVTDKKFTIEPCSQTLIVLSGGPGLEDVRAQVEYVGETLY